MKDKDSIKIRDLYKPLQTTILHPQWFSFRGKKTLIEWIKKIPENSIVIDVGCADRWAENYLDKTSSYIGLDYLETADAWYGSDVDIYATASALPLRENSVDAIILFDVLEHLNNYDIAISEVSRALKPGGVALVQIPYLYPLHDCPNDYQRLTYYGLLELAKQEGLTLDSFGYRGEPLETAVLLLNIALAKSVLVFSKNHLLLKLLIYPVIGTAVVLLNCFGWVSSKILPNDNFMPFSYHMILKK